MVTVATTLKEILALMLQVAIILVQVIQVNIAVDGIKFMFMYRMVLVKNRIMILILKNTRVAIKIEIQE